MRSRLRKLIELFSGLGLRGSDAGKVRIGPTDRGVIVTLPEALDFEENYEETCHVFSILRKAVECKWKLRRIEFGALRSLSTSAALVLASAMDQWNKRVKGSLKADLASWSGNIRKLLCQMGYFELLGLRRPKTSWSSEGMTFLPFLSGRVGEADAGAKARLLRINIEQMVGRPIIRTALFDGLSEAITNAGQHAYREVEDKNRRFWWLSASFDDHSQELRVAFYDKGHGIPKTLKSHELFASIREFFTEWSDAKKIQAAMELGRTSSGKAERGKGLQNLIEFAKAHPKGLLSITSLRGTYSELHRRGPGPVPSKPEISMKSHTNSIGGTLIEWSVSLQ